MLVELVEDHLRRAAHVARAVGERQLRPERLDRGDVVDDGLDLAPGVIVGTEPRRSPWAG